MTCSTSWFPFYIGDYQADTMHLTCEQHGAYFLLMQAYYRTARPLPDDNLFLAGIVKLTRQRWHAMRPVLAHFFQIGDDGLWRHKRIDAEIVEQQARSEERSRAGQNGAALRWKKSIKSTPEGVAQPMAQLSPSSPVQNRRGIRHVKSTKSTAAHVAEPMAEPMAEPSDYNGAASPVQKGQGKAHAKSTKSTAQPVAKPMAQPCVSYADDFVVETACPVQIQQGIEGSNPIKSMAPACHTSQGSSLPLTGQRELPTHVRARDDAASAVAMGDGDAASRSSTPEPAAEAADPTFKADGAAMFDECLAIIRGKRLVLDSDSGLPVPPDTRILEFQATLSRYNTLAGEKLTGDTRLLAWDAIGRADAIGDPDDIPPDLAADLAAIASLDATA